LLMHRSWVSQVALRAVHALLRLKQQMLRSEDGNGIWHDKIGVEVYL